MCALTVHSSLFLTAHFLDIVGSPVATSSPKSSEEIKQARRRLSVMSDNKLVEGFETAVNLDEPEEVSKMLP